MALNWTSLYKKYKGKWVALTDDERTVVAFGKSAREAWERAAAKGNAHPILSHIPEELITYVGSGL